MDQIVKNGELYFGGCSTEMLTERYGTPLYVISRQAIHDRINELKQCFTNKYDNTRIAYAAKAFCTSAMMKICQKEGICVDVVSGGELYTAIKAGFPPERIEFNGNNKLPEEIYSAVEYGIGRIIIDGMQELELIEKACKKMDKHVKVLYRVTPGVDVHTHGYVVTGKKDSKFGIPLDEDVIYPMVEKAIKSDYVDFLGFHFHIGSQLFDFRPYVKSLDVILELSAQVKKRYGYDISEINLGGGFGARYKDEDRKPYNYFIEPMMDRLTEFYKNHNSTRPAVVVEPGRSIVAEAGISLYTIGSIKEIKDVCKYVSVDGGMSDNIRPALYGAIYDGVVANKADQPKSDKVNICGKCCESGDILIKNIKITPNAEPGDIFAIFSTGAYGYSMASNYNRNPIPPVVLVNNGHSELIIRRQTYEDLTRYDIIPESLR